MGVSVVPKLTPTHFQREALVTWPLAAPGPTRAIHLVQRREGGLFLAARTLHDLVLRRMRSLEPADVAAH